MSEYPEIMRKKKVSPLAVLRERVRTALSDQERNAWWISLAVIAASLVGIAFYFYLALGSRAWQHFSLVGITVLLLLVGLVGAALSRRGRGRTGIWLILVIGQFSIAVSPLFTAGQGLWYGAGIMMATLIIGTLALPPASAMHANFLGVLAGFAALLLDGFVSEYQLPPPLMLRYFVPAVFLVLTLFYLLILSIFFRAYNLRSKITITMFSVAVISIAILAAVNNYTTRRELIRSTNQTLLVAADYTARNVDEYLETLTLDISSKATAPELVQYLSASQAERAQVQVRASSYLLTLLARSDALAYALTDRNGKVVLHTQHRDTSQLEAFLGLGDLDRNSFRITLLGGTPFISSVVFPGGGFEPYFYVGQRVVDESDKPIGMLLASYPISTIQFLVKESRGLAGEGSFGVLLDSNYLRIAHSGSGEGLYQLVYPLPEEQMRRMIAAHQLPNKPLQELATNFPEYKAGLDNITVTPFFASQEIGTGDMVNSMAVVRLENNSWLSVYMQPQAIVLRPAEEQTRTTVLVAALIAGLTVVVSTALARLLTNPVLHLTTIAEQVARGNLAIQVTVESQDEIGALSKVFNTMTNQLRQTLEGLEQRVAERTAELAKTSEQMQYRAQRLQKIAEVAHNIAAEQDPDKLLPLVTETISKQFGYYHVGVFLLDSEGEYAVLQAANSEGGKRMLQRGHRLKVGEVGLVGYVAKRGEPRIALDVGKDAVFFDNPDLPRTRSEIALPLKVGVKVIGVLDVQSVEPGAFTADDAALLSALADQVAMAIQNARLFAETQRALREAQIVQRQYVREEWGRLASERVQMGYQYLFGSLKPIQADQGDEIEVLSEMGEKGLAIPISVRGEVIGVIQLGEAEGDRVWSEEEVALARSVADQVGLALENARLLEVTRRRAERERMVAEITTRLRATNDPRQILDAAATELRNALRAKSVRVRIQPKEQDIVSKGS